MLPIRLRGATTHNLASIDLDLAPGELVALTGPSGAGKSSLALDTLYAEGQRRFVESFSPYARQFLERLERPPVRALDPVAATVAVDRRAPVKSSRSTVATLTDLEPYLAALFACEAVPSCPDCGEAAIATSAVDAAKRALADLPDRRALVSYPVRIESPEAYLELREGLVKDGYRRLVVGGAVREIDDVRPSEAGRPDVAVEVVVDRLKLGKNESRRLQQAIEIAWERSDGRAELRAEGGVEGGPAHLPIGRGLVCPSCARSFDPPRPGLFSYNSPLGACAACRGFGRVIAVDWDKVIPDKDRSIDDGAIKAWSGRSSEWERDVLRRFAKKRKIPLDVPWSRLSDEQRRLVIDGEGEWAGGKYPGVAAWFKWLETRTYKMHVRVFLSRYRDYVPCTTCAGARLNKVARTYHVAGLDLGAWHALTVEDARARLDSVTPANAQGGRVKAELASRLAYLDAVGLSYLSLDRQARTLSGGEAQRASLTTALGASLTGTLFVLDEPTVGLHATDVPRLARAMDDLARAGNTVLVIEHDRDVVERCDRIVELGPGAGPRGGRLLFSGTPAELAKSDTATGRAWRKGAFAKRRRRAPAGWLTLQGARENNLAIDEVRVPLGVLCAITGPSGSGKSTLAEDVLYRAIARRSGESGVPKPGSFESLRGDEALKRAVLVDQSPLGRTARGNAATYTKAWDRVRMRFAAEPEARRRGLSPASFSFNVPGKGRCESCSGEGYETVEMQFLADVMLLCPVCHGKRFNADVLAVTSARRGAGGPGRTVADVLAMTVEEALAFLSPGDDRDYVTERALQPLVEVGLGYLPLGQPLSTLSGGEAQRLKLARALSSETAGTLFVVDEPSAGLHAEDATHVVRALRALVDAGASVIMVEHDLSVVCEADWVIDLGPGGGPRGGAVVAAGTPEEIGGTPTKTGEALRARSAVSDKAGGRRGAASPSPRTSAAARRAERPREATRRALAPDAISVHHAREHNLKDVSCKVPHGKLCVVTGPSGSGKSSLAFDVVFAEGQRRFMETLTPYARQFLPTLPRPDVDLVTGVPPSIALEQRTSRAGANSTVATVTEIAHYLRLLYAKVGDLHCPKCGGHVAPSSPDELFARIRAEGGKRTLYSPAVRARKGTYLDVFTNAARAGVQSARVDGAIVAIDPPPKLAKAKEHSIDLIVHYGALDDLDRAAFDRALLWGGGAVRLARGTPTAAPAPGEEIFSTARACTACGTGIPELDPRWFSFNTKQGQCEACEGSGLRGGYDDDGDADEGKPRAKCRVCDGARLAPIPRSVRLGGETYPDVMNMSVAAALAMVERLTLTGKSATIAKAPLAELVRRLGFVVRVGLGYLGLGRAASTLSGGEMQRLRLSAQLGSGLTGALYVLDEPTIGLHPRDTKRLIANLRALVDTGSTVLVVEHDAETILAADHLTDLGPSGGRSGGHVIAEGAPAAVLATAASPTGQALREPFGVVRPRRPTSDAWIELEGARANNLHDVTFRVPVGRMCVVAGVSGSGKSTLVQRVFFPALRRELDLVAPTPGPHRSIKVPKTVRRALAVDQSPIGRTPRSVPATFLGVWDEIRRLFAALPESKVRGYTPARFSFNTPQGGRCTACDGQGSIVAEMSFLPEVVTPCETCQGARFEPATLDVRWAGLSIGDVLRLSAEDAATVFSAHPKIARPLRTLAELGVGYVALGQGSNTLSGGEAQRLKLASELTAGSAHEPTVYVLDEPTTGLHLSDVARLVRVLDRLVERGDTLVIVEHHPDVIANADWVVELGPEAGEAGGRVVFEGEPRALVKKKTATGRALARPSPGRSIEAAE
ncbi:MAG: excinuclease ABC subunit UvrA [Labilithrix sp.]|nr:excinuclease ABC subunit UvrA [Labilithrix sp.]